MDFFDFLCTEYMKIRQERILILSLTLNLKVFSSLCICPLRSIIKPPYQGLKGTEALKIMPEVLCQELPFSRVSSFRDTPRTARPDTGCTPVRRKMKAADRSAKKIPDRGTDTIPEEAMSHPERDVPSMVPRLAAVRKRPLAKLSAPGMVVAIQY